MAYAPAQMTALEALIPGLAAPRPSLPRRLVAALKARHARRQQIREYEALMRVDGHMLDDIGISRDDVHAALQAAHRS